MKIQNIILALLVFIFGACDPYLFELGKHSSFIFENKSNVDIAVEYDYNNLEKKSNKITVLKGRIKANNEDMVVSANSKKHVLMIMHATWETLLKDAHTDTLKLFVLDYAKIRDYPIDNKMDSVPFDSVFIQRYDLTIPDLDNLNWTLSYPPTEAMKDIKMWPPYGQ
jgi:hypothetical protein